MDQQFRDKQRRAAASPGDAEALHAYIQALEQLSGLRPSPSPERVRPTDTQIPCLICEISIIGGCGWTSPELTNVKTLSWDKAVIICTTKGQYGSQVLDSDGQVYFVICDSCLISQSHKMLIAPLPVGNVQNASQYFEAYDPLI